MFNPGDKVLIKKGVSSCSKNADGQICTIKEGPIPSPIKGGALKDVPYYNLEEYSGGVWENEIEGGKEEKMQEIRVGDKVRCIDSGSKGSGWESGLEFTVTSISEGHAHEETIYFGGYKGNGVYGNSLELVKEKEAKPVRSKKIKLPNIKLSMNDIIGQDNNKKMLKLAIECDMPVLLVGETGTGKTTIIREQAIEHNADWLRFNLTGETTVDEFVGRYELEGGETKWRDGILLQAMKTGKWLIVDEINVALPEILFVLHSLLDDDKFVVVASHNGEIVKPHKDFRFFATMNPCDEYAGTKELNKAFQSRFNMILELEYPIKEVETKIVADKAEISQAQATKMADVALALREAKSKDKVFYTCSTRDLIYWGNLVREGLDMDEAFIVSILNKAPSDKENINQIYGVIMGRYLNLEKSINAEPSIDYLEKKFAELDKERKEFEAKKDKLREEITKDIVEKLTGKDK